MKTTHNDPTVRWIKVRSIVDGYLTINMDAISTISPCGHGLSMRLLCGTLILLTHKEGNRVLSRILPEGIRP